MNTKLECYFCFVISLNVFCLFYAEGHGIFTDPRQRGALRLDNHPVPTIDWNAPTDYASHYPAGSKNKIPGSGTASLRRAAGNFWTPYDPFNPFFHWRSGVCGDELGGPQDHLLGGKYFYNGRRVRQYIQGSVIFMEAEIVTHHNGYFEFFVCNLDTCGSDISTRCFKEGHCRKLLRNPGPCDSGTHMGCGPIDRYNPSRWYLPCKTTEPMMMGGWSRTMAYVLPPDLICEHCVIQWYWTAANTCNPPGVHEYFSGPDAPNWQNCPGQGGAVNGWSWNKPTCGGSLFPEEYFQCADIRIVRNPNTPSMSNLPPPVSTSSSQATTNPHPINLQPSMTSGGTSSSTASSTTSSTSSFSARPPPGARGRGDERVLTTSSGEENNVHTHENGENESQKPSSTEPISNNGNEPTSKPKSKSKAKQKKQAETDIDDESDDEDAAQNALGLHHTQTD